MAFINGLTTDWMDGEWAHIRKGLGCTCYAWCCVGRMAHHSPCTTSFEPRILTAPDPGGFLHNDLLPYTVHHIYHIINRIRTSQYFYLLTVFIFTSSPMFKLLSTGSLKPYSRFLSIFSLLAFFFFLCVRVFFLLSLA